MKRWESTGQKIGGCQHYIFLFSMKACLIAVLFSITVKLISLRVFWENRAKQHIKALRHSVRKELLAKQQITEQIVLHYNTVIQ